MASDGVWAPGRRALTVGLVFTITLVGFEGLAVATVLKVINDDLDDIGQRLPEIGDREHE